MSEHAQNRFYIYHSRLSDLLQEVQGRRPVFSALLARLLGRAPTVRVQPLSVRVRLLVVWGVLVTARRGDEILSAWVVADQASQPVGSERVSKAREQQGDLRRRIEELVRAMRLQVRSGSYAVQEAAFRQVASFSPEPERLSKGGH